MGWKDAPQVTPKWQDAPPLEGQPPPQQPASLFDQYVAPTLRGSAKAIAALPLTALEAGAGIGNMVNQGTVNATAEVSPRRTFQEALDRILPPPQTWQGQVAEVGTELLGASKVPVGMASRTEAAPAAFKPAEQALRDQLFAESRAAGYTLPPSAVNPSLKYRALEGVAGKTKVGQEAIARNWAVTDDLAKKAVGETAPLTPGGLSKIRTDAYNFGYEPVRSAGTISPKQDYFDRLDKIVSSSVGAARSFGDAAAPNTAVERISKLKDIKSFDAGDAVDMIKVLRDDADKFFRQGDNAAGRASRSAANALEDALEASLGGEALKNFRNARKLIAKTYTAGKALTGEGGTSKASVYASELQKGRPLEGEQRQIGRFASTFGKYAPNPRGEIFPAGSPIDVYGSGGLAALTDSALPLAYPIARFGMGKYLLSDAVQNGLVSQGLYQPQNTLGLLGGAGATWPYLLNTPSSAP